MSYENDIEISFGMKYDLSNVTKSSLAESFSEYRKLQGSVRNSLIRQNEIEKKKIEKPKNRSIYYKIKEKENNECELDFTDEKVIPKGYFCYPLKGGYFQKSSFEMKYFPILPLYLFKEGINTFKNQKDLAETYLSYPCLLEKDFNRITNKIIKKEIKDINKNFFNNNDITSNSNDLAVRPSNCTNNINKYFIIWSFIQILKGQMIIMDEDFKKIYNRDKDKIIIEIIDEMSKYLNIEINILYYIIITFLNDVNKKIIHDSALKKGISYKKYEKYWCRICNRFFCPFHFKIKVKEKKLLEGNIRTSYKYFKNIQITLRPPEYLYKEEEEIDDNKNELEYILKDIISKCDCNKKNEKNPSENHDSNSKKKHEKFIFDESNRFNKMLEMKDKEDFFILCKVIRSCSKLLIKNFNGYYDNDKIFNKFLAPCILKKILGGKYNCDLLRYLIQIIINDKYLSDINIFFKTLSGIPFESFSEENLLFFNNSSEIMLPKQKYTHKGEKKIIKILRNKSTARQQADSEKNLYFKPCDHYPAECTPKNCPCVKRGMCLKYCCCFKEQSLDKPNDCCRYLYYGCQVHSNSKTANCSKCICSQYSIECIPGVCKCEGKCTNNNITLGKRKKLIYGFSNRINGGGLFAGEDIKNDEFIDIYVGEMVEKDELDRLSVFFDQTGNNYPFNINNKYDYVTIKGGGLTRFINHGSFDEENIKANKKMVNGIPYIAFYANRDIKKYEELFYDYSYDENSMPNWMKEYNSRMEKKKKKEEKNRLYHQNKYNKNKDKSKNGNSKHKKKEKEKEDNKDLNSNESITLDEESD